MKLPGFTAHDSLAGNQSSVWRAEPRHSVRALQQVVPQLRCWGWEWGFACCTAGVPHYCLRCDLFDCSITRYPSAIEDAR